MSGKCPICGKPSLPASPFCSPRCQDVDLHRWFNGSYAIPVTEGTDEDGESVESPKLAPDQS